jgi:hypothetical protein
MSSFAKRVMGMMSTQSGGAVSEAEVVSKAKPDEDEEQTVEAAEVVSEDKPDEDEEQTVEAELVE